MARASGMIPNSKGSVSFHELWLETGVYHEPYGPAEKREEANKGKPRSALRTYQAWLVTAATGTGIIVIAMMAA